MTAILIIIIVFLIIVILEEKNTSYQLRRKLDENQEKIDRLEKDLRNFIDIEKDSMNLNVEEIDELEDIEELPSKENIDSHSKDDITTTKYDLNTEKSILLNLMENTNTNMFITGKAGTGKSYLLKVFKKTTKKKVLYCAPTGIAALNISGVTLHSAFGWNNLVDDADIRLSNNKIALFKSIDTLIIDEISMVRVDVFNQLDRILKKANNTNIAFGGKQVILFGDLFQLPPVAKKEEAEYFTDKYGGIFFFNSPAYKNAKFEFKELEDVFRQTDKKFINILNDIRVGKIRETQISSLNKHYVENKPERVVEIVPMKSDANRINLENLNKIKGRKYIYNANILVGDKELKETDFPCDFELELKVGALVMMITNDQEHKRWVNGTLGIIKELSNSMVKVMINGTEFEISPTTFNKYKCEYDRKSNQLNYIVESSVSQYPLILAYAITIHKYQGMTYQQIACNLDNCFAPGQAYVALSRCANYEKLYLTKKIDASSIITDNVVANFYKSVSKNK